VVFRKVLMMLLALLASGAALVHAEKQTVEAGTGDLPANIASLASLDFPVRMHAARLIRRTPGSSAVPALTEAVRKSTNEFVRYRALVLLTAFNDPGTGELVREVLRDRNDRVRQVAFEWLERHPERSSATTLLPLLQVERADFVRPALVGALAALGEAAVQRPMIAEVARGLDFFRSAVIDALGRHRAAFALDAIVGIARVEGPLQDDAVLAVGRIGGPDAREILSEPTRLTPEALVMRHAARCLIGDDCQTAVKALTAAATTPAGRAGEVRAAIEGLSAVAQNREGAALATLVHLASVPGPVRDRAAVALATVAVRQPDWIVARIQAADVPTREAAIMALKDGFDSLEEDFAEEQFFAAVRAGYWRAAEGGPERALASTLIQRLEF